MRWIFVSVLLLITITNTHQKPRNATSELFEMRESLRHQSPFAILRDANEALSSVLPKELILSETDQLKQLTRNIVRNFTSPGNVRVLMHYVRESQIRNKGEIIRIMMRFMNPENLSPEGLIRTFKNLDSHTVTEMNEIYLKYLKFLEPKIFGHDYDGLLKYINEEDIKLISQLLFDVFQATDSRDLLWLAQRVQEERQEAEKNAEELLHTESDAILKTWEQRGEQELRNKVMTIIQDIQRVGAFEKFSAKGSQMTDAVKQSLLHFLDNFFTDLQNVTANVDPHAAREKLTKSIQDGAEMLSGLLEMYDVDELGMDVERAIDYVKTLNTSSALATLSNIRKYLPTVEKLMDQINRIEFMKPEDKSKLTQVIIHLNQTHFSPAMNEFLMDTFLSEVHKIDAQRVRRLVEFFAKESHIDNDVYLILKSIGMNLFNDATKHGVVDFEGKTWEDLRREIERNVKAVDSRVTEDLMHELIADVEHLNASAVADVVADGNTAVKDLLADDLLLRALEKPSDFFENLNRTVFADLVYLGLDAMKVIHIDDFSRRCRNLSSLATDDLKVKVVNATKWVEDQFDRVENGSIAAKKLKIREISALLQNFVENVDLKGVCDDFTALLRANREFGVGARGEIARVLWDGFQMVKNATSPDGIDKETLKKVQGMIDALLKALVKTERERPENAGLAVMRLAVRSVKEITENGLYIRKPKIESDDDEEGFLQRLKKIAVKHSTTPGAVSLPETTTFVPVKTTFASVTPFKTTFAPVTPATTTSVPVTQHLTKKVETTSTERVFEAVQVVEFLVTSEDTSDCKKHVDILLKTLLLSDAIAPEQLWAATMLDSWTPLLTIRSDLYSTKRRQCLSIPHTESSTPGQFCNATLQKPLGVNETTQTNYGVCIPTSCSVADWNAAVANISETVAWRGMIIDSSSCVNKIETEDSKLKQYSWIFAVLVVWIFSSSFYEYQKRKFADNAEPSKIFCSFSLYTTLKGLFGPAPDDWPAGIDGARVIALAFVILHNTLDLSTPILNDSEDGHFSRELRYMPAMNVSLAVDTLLFTSGLLLVWSFLTKMRKNKQFDVIGEPLRQALNWALILLAAMLLRSHLLRSEDSNESICVSSWWHHILFVSNFLDPDYSCLPYAWYLSMEMQLMVFTLALLFLFYLMKNSRWMVSAFLLITFTAVPFSVLFGLGSFKVYPEYGDDQFWADFVKPYTRAVAWIVGIITGFVIFKQDDYEFQMKLSPSKAIIAMIISHGFCIGCAQAAYAFVDPVDSTWLLPMYIAVSRLGFSAGLSVIIILCVSNNGGLYAKLMSASVFKILNRILLSTFISHVMVINLRLAHFSSIYLDDYSLILAFFADLVMSNILGFILHISVERPIGNFLRAVSFPMLPLPRKTHHDAIPFE